MYANVIVDITQESLDRTFQYRIPEGLQAQAEPGMVVKIPFGKGGRQILGYITELTDRPEIDPGRIKEILELSTEGVGVESRLIALASWIREYYGSTMIQALKTVIPVKKKEKAKAKTSLVLTASAEEAAEKLSLFQKKHQLARARLLEALLAERELPMELVTKKLNITAPVIRALEEMGLIRRETVQVYRNPIHLEGGTGPRLVLNRAQQAVVDAVVSRWDDPQARPYLIHGVTGCGKTEIYMELIAHAIEKGQQAIVLIPEIALTYQTVIRFYRRFGARISILNSRLSKGERYDQYERARKGLIDVIIGPRSALFAPFPNLGIIIVDEEHETSYKSETVPRYLAREVAVKRGELEGARVVMGSATPSLEAYYKAKNGVYTLFTIEERVEKRSLPTVLMADLRTELARGNRSILSERLKEEMAEALGKKQQIMLFLNRRGYAGFLSCRSCGTVIKCPHCDVSLSLHRNGRLVCHYCGYETDNPGCCPSCGSGFLRSFGIGTQQAEELVQREFPQARILRMDLDTTREKDGHEKILSAFADREADILIGTQMIVKGHDFPGVTLVGILAADMSLHASDYRAAERTFQLLTQAAGRAGRGKEPGKVVIQTYDPEHYSIQAAVRQDYESFYQQEILYRKISGYPPAGSMMAIHGSCGEEDYLELAMNYLKKFLDRLAGRYQAGIIGPADENVAKINDVYRKVIYVKQEEERVLTMLKAKAEQYMEINEGFQKITVQFERC
ncbi:MAG: primosomal protein N' [Candidatus Limivivens sp.]|nr:primosomal protein N' [Candidatus Limivivens sp.]